MRCTRPLTADAILVSDDRLVLVRRGQEPYKGKLALPGGFVELAETVEEAVVREAKEETGLDVEILRLVGVYSDPLRDPRGPVVSICYLVKAVGGTLAAASDAAGAELLAPADVPPLAFDHNRMVEDAEPFLREALLHAAANENMVSD